MVVGQHDELDCVKGVSALCEHCLERLERLRVRRARVHERERVSLEQPDVDGAEVRHRDLDPVHVGGQRVGCGIDSSHRRCLA